MFLASGQATARQGGNKVKPVSCRPSLAEVKRPRTGVVKRLPRQAVPDERRLALSSDPDALKHILAVAQRLEASQALANAFVDAARVRSRIVLVPAWLWVDCARGAFSGALRGDSSVRTLFKLDLVRTDNVSPLIEDVEPAGGGAAVDRAWSGGRVSWGETLRGLKKEETDPMN